MDNLLYVTITDKICLISLIGAVVMITLFITKKKVTPPKAALFLLFLIGMYLYIPMKLTLLGFSYQKPSYLKKAVKLSINPYEKRLCYKYLAEIYADDIFYQNLKDGNKAIENMEHALKGEYEKYVQEATLLAYWYSIKGDEKKVFEITQKLNLKKGIALRNIYIMKDDYKSALETFSENNSVENYLKADLYKKLGDLEASKKAREIAQKTYNSNMEQIKTRAKRLEYKEETEKYKTTDAYKNWIISKRKEYSFN